MKRAIHWVDKGLVPSPLVRFGIRRLLRRRLADEALRHSPDPERTKSEWLEQMRRSPVAIETRAANEQHYELPPAFFQEVLGPRLKYSSCLYPGGNETLAQAEEAMLALTCERARLADGQRVLELGCGWGSLSLWMAERYPSSRILAVSNSAPQRRFIEARAAERGLSNLTVITRDMNEFDAAEHVADAGFDRVVSVEMFEHMRNWEHLLGRVSGWLAPDARVFIHVFAHRDFDYPFDVVDESDWMSRYFFTGGMMPSPDLMHRLDAPLAVEESWNVDGKHYACTAEHWLANLDARRSRVMPALRETYGDAAEAWFQRWRVFFLSCAELFGYRDGSEWFVAHYLLRRRAEAPE